MTVYLPESLYVNTATSVIDTWNILYLSGETVLCLVFGGFVVTGTPSSVELKECYALLGQLFQSEVSQPHIKCQIYRHKLAHSWDVISEIGDFPTFTDSNECMASNILSKPVLKSLSGDGKCNGIYFHLYSKKHFIAFHITALILVRLTLVTEWLDRSISLLVVMCCIYVISFSAPLQSLGQCFF